MKALKRSFYLFVLASLCLHQGLSTFAAEAMMEEKHHFELGSKPRLDLENVNGAVRIQGTSRHDIQVVATRRGKSTEDVERITVEMKASGSVLKIRTRLPRFGFGLWGNNRQGRVDYSIEVPKSTVLDNVETVNGSIKVEGVEGAVHISTVNGSVQAEDLSAAAEIKTVNGQVQASFARFEKNSTFDAVNGALRIRLPSSPNATIEASTVNGRIHSDFGEVKKGGMFPGKSMKATLGGGSARLKASTVNGSIHFQKAGMLKALENMVPSLEKN